MVINRMAYYILQGREKHPAGEVGNSVAVLLQIYFSVCVLKIIKFDAV